MTTRGRFIVFEGLDGAGTTTQAARLHGSFTRKRAKSFATFEPTGAPVGEFVRNVLSGRLPGPDGTPLRVPEEALCLLFAADRVTHGLEIRRHLAAGIHVICDRYLFSSLAYQTRDESVTPDWVAQCNRGVVVPDVTLFLSVPVDECLRRIALRNEAPSVYERRDVLATISSNYERLMGFYRERYGPLAVVDGAQSPDAVERDCLLAAGVTA